MFKNNQQWSLEKSEGWYLDEEFQKSWDDGKIFSNGGISGHVTFRHPAAGSMVLGHDGKGGYKVTHMDTSGNYNHLTNKQYVPKDQAMKLARDTMNKLHVNHSQKLKNKMEGGNA